MMPPKRVADGSPGGGPAKIPKSEHKPEDFSVSVKKRLQSSTRTGQACDRCKVRKIRCDGLPGGCSPCLQNQTECRTTDRITGRAAPRGYVDNIEQQNRALEARVRELEALLVQNGVEVKPSAYHDTGAPVYNFNGGSQSTQQTGWPASGNSGTYAQGAASRALASSQQETNMFRTIPSLRSSYTGDNYLGVSTGLSHLSSIKGTALSILGMEIDVADFPSIDMDEPESGLFHPQLYNKSYQGFLQSVLAVNSRIDKVDLPGREEGLTYAQWYFRVFNPYLPLLHKPTFMKLLTRMYDDPTFRPTAGQNVMVHMVFAIMFFQYAVRNSPDSTTQQTQELNNQSNLHYHYSLGLFYQLCSSHTLEDAQALALICTHLRNFPKPGASWVLTTTTLGLAIELGMHRSSKHSQSTKPPNYLEIEMRKRVFWCLLACHVTLAGKLGRPMYLRLEDFDVELPEPVPDEQITETGIDTTRPGTCEHLIGLATLKLVPVFLEMQATIYAVRRNSETYIEDVNRLEARLRQWITDLPPELVRGESGSDMQEGRIFSLYLEFWTCEFRILLRHPSTSITIDAAFNAESMQICVDSARKMLGIVTELQKLRSLDTTWYNSAVYVMGITTTLFGQWERRSEMTTSDLADLRIKMDMWLDIMSVVGSYLGSGCRLRDKVRNVTERTLDMLSQYLLEKNSNLVGSSNSGPEALNSPHSRPGLNQPKNLTNGVNHPPYAVAYSENSGSTQSGTTATYLPPESQLTHQQTPYPAATQYSSYPDPTPSSSTMKYPSHEPHTHPYSTYSNTATDSVEAPLLAAFANQASQAQVAQHTWPSSNGHNEFANSGSQSWQQWTSTMSGNLEPQDCYSASALMQLGGRDIVSTESSGTPAPVADMTSVQGVGMSVNGAGRIVSTEVLSANGSAWPLNIFDMSQNSAAT